MVERGRSTTPALEDKLGTAPVAAALLDRRVPRKMILAPEDKRHKPTGDQEFQLAIAESVLQEHDPDDPGDGAEVVDDEYIRRTPLQVSAAVLEHAYNQLYPTPRSSGLRLEVEEFQWWSGGAAMALVE